MAEHNLTSIVNKMINIGSELDSKGLNKGQMSNLKILTSTNEPLTINPKNKGSFQLESDEQPKLIFSGNNKPNASSMDGGVFRRMLMLSFDEEIQDNEKIRGLSDRFNDEMGGILNLALAHLQNLISRGYFTKSEKLKENIEDYKDQQNNTRKYIKDNISFESGVMISKKLLHSHYVAYCEDKGLHPKGEPNFIKDIIESIKGVEDIGQQRINISCLNTQRPRFINNVYVNDYEVKSFHHNKEEIETKNINIDRKSKMVVYKDEDSINE